LSHDVDEEEEDVPGDDDGEGEDVVEEGVKVKRGRVEEGREVSGYTWEEGDKEWDGEEMLSPIVRVVQRGGGKEGAYSIEEAFSPVGAVFEVCGF
jgi:hypothetical protein